MAWNYTEPRRERRPLATPVRPASTGGTGGAPSGPAGGDLAGTYPNPQLAAGTIVDADVSATAAIQYTKLSGVPTALPPSGTAGGDLTGTYPNPSVGSGKITPGKLDRFYVETSDTYQTGCDLTGQVMSPQLRAGVIVDADVSATAAIQYTKLAGTPTALPPSGAASGDLGGTYPAPTVAKLNGATVGTTTPLARGDVLVANATPAIVRLALGATGTVFQSNGTDAVWATPPSAPPTGAASGDLTGTYPGPTIGALKVTDAKINDVAATKLSGTIAQARFPVAPAGLLTANVNDAQITDVKIASVAYGKVTGTPTSLPPSGAASGDLTGSYPAPTIATLNGATVGTTTPLARGDLLVANATPALVRLARGTVNQVLQSNGTDVLWGPAPATGGPPTGTAGGSLAGSYPNPTLATTGVTAATYGTQYKVASITVNAEGRITAVVEITVRARWG